MSDAAKSAEHIEDVLTAIRRLVAEAPRDDSSDPHEAQAALSDGEDAANTGPDTGPETGEGAPKLVLTQSLRIIDADDPWAPVPRADEEMVEDADVIAAADEAGDAHDADDADDLDDADSMIATDTANGTDHDTDNAMDDTGGATVDADAAEHASIPEPVPTGSQDLLVLGPQNETGPTWALDDRLSEWGEPGQGAATAEVDTVEAETSQDTVENPVDTTEQSPESDATADGDDDHAADRDDGSLADATDTAPGADAVDLRDQADALAAVSSDTDAHDVGHVNDEAEGDTSAASEEVTFPLAPSAQDDEISRAADFHAATSEARFERETGDDEWPHTTADSALQVIAAARAGGVANASSDSDAETDSAEADSPDAARLDAMDADATPMISASRETVPTHETTEAPMDEADRPEDACAGHGAAMDVMRDANGVPHPDPRDDTHAPAASASDQGTAGSDAEGSSPSEEASDADTKPPLALGTGPRADDSEQPAEADMLPIYARRALLKSLLAADDKFPPEVLARVTRTQTPSGTDPSPSPQAEPDAKAVQDALDPLVLNGGALSGLDADALRDLVEEAVRQELQGALGERITRNVRKMVRREIRMAMAADALE